MHDFILECQGNIFVGHCNKVKNIVFGKTLQYLNVRTYSLIANAIRNINMERTQSDPVYAYLPPEQCVSKFTFMTLRGFFSCTVIQFKLNCTS